MVYDVLVIGAGAAGLMCAIEAGRRGRRVLVLDKSNKPGKKILMSGGGRCNFTNYYIEPSKYISHNPHFCKSALSRYTQWDFINMVEAHGIPYYEKTLGQLFCERQSSDILNMLLGLCESLGVTIRLNQDIESVDALSLGFRVRSCGRVYDVESVVVASGGLSIPTMGASPFGYQLALAFGHHVYPTRAALVPFTLHDKDKERFDGLSGVSVDCEVLCNKQSFQEMMLFTHRGLSGPAMLQISSYWEPGDDIKINWLYQTTLSNILTQSEQSVRNALSAHIPKRLLSVIFDEQLLDKAVKQLLPDEWILIEKTLSEFLIKPNNTEGYRTAEVTLGGVDCDEVSSKTFMSLKQQGLYFIGEVLDVTGWLGGYNFQWAWSSGFAAGQVV